MYNLFRFTMPISTERVEFRPEKPKLPRGWAKDYSQFTFEPENPEELLNKPHECPNCDQSMDFSGWTSGNSLVGNSERTAHLIFQMAPLFRCNPCEFEMQDPDALREIDRKATEKLKELGIR